jgi:cytochrome c oxidase subunit 2
LGPRAFLRRSRLPAAAAVAALGALLLTAGPALADAVTPESGGSPNADRIDSLYKLVLVVAILVFLGVQGTLLYSVIRFRAKRGLVPAQIRGNTRLEIAWTAGTALILVVIVAITFIKLPGIRNPARSGANGLASASGALYASADQPTPPGGDKLNIDVNGQQYIWRYTYPDGDDNVLNNAFSYEEMVVPVDTTVTLDIRAQDVAHSWWIPKLGGKMDAVPGYTNHTWFKIGKPGVYYGQCAELCGRNHANMVARVRALPVADYQAWVANQKREIKAANQAAAAQRQTLSPIRDRPQGG